MSIRNNANSEKFPTCDPYIPQCEDYKVTNGDTCETLQTIMTCIFCDEGTTGGTCGVPSPITKTYSGGTSADFGSEDCHTACGVTGFPTTVCDVALVFAG
ncbi:MAG: hypothetical protein HRU36_03500 [Rickettsiales bacterium]|nr:hypothetical protein [Rickettsiales bacterium]